MNSEVFSRNLRRLRLQKELTQERLAGILGVSVQTVSRWECGNTLPDVMLLPEIARIYGVTVDDLYRDDARGYSSYSQRLLAVYEASGRSEDFLAAEQEFLRQDSREMTADDLRSWGILYHYMTQQCAALAQKKLEEAMDHPAVSEKVWLSAALQKKALMVDLGRGREEEERCEKELAENPEDPKRWDLASACALLMKNYDRALELAQEGIRRFPDRALLYIHAGDAMRELKHYEEAFRYWKDALSLNSEFLDAAFSMAFCHEELGQYRQAHEVWTDLAKELNRRGLPVEAEFPKKQAENCWKRLTRV